MTEAAPAVRVSPRERSVTTTRVVIARAAVKGAEPLLSYRTKATYFSPTSVTITARQYADGTWIAEHVVVQGWKIHNGRPGTGQPRSAFFNTPDGMIYAPEWLKDHMGKLMTELVELYPANT